MWEAVSCYAPVFLDTLGYVSTANYELLIIYCSIPQAFSRVSLHESWAPGPSRTVGFA